MKKSAKPARSKERAALDLKVRYQNADALKPYAGNARTHSDKQIAQIAAPAPLQLAETPPCA